MASRCLFLMVLLAGGEAAAELAWNGAVTGDALTELRVTLATDATAKTLRLSRAGLVVTRAAEPGTPLIMPLSPTGPGEVSVELVGDGSTTTIMAGRLHAAANGGVVSGARAAARLSAANLQWVAPAGLPRIASAYRHIDSLAIDGVALASLDDAQLRALLGHAGHCGRLLLLEVTPAAQRIVQQRAACGGQYLRHAAAGDDARRMLDELRATMPRPLPDARELERLLADHSPTVTGMALLLAGFTAIYLLLLAAGVTSYLQIAYCLLVSVCAAFFFNTASQPQQAAWAEASADERLARYRSVERFTSGGRGASAIASSSLARSPTAIEGNGLRLSWSEQGAERALTWTAAVLQRLHITDEGNFAVDPALRATATAAVATVCNTGNVRSQPAQLHWRGETYALPALPGGSQWNSEDKMPLSSDEPALSVLARRAPSDGLAILQALPVPGNGRGYLMRTEPQQPGVSPCSA